MQESIFLRFLSNQTDRKENRNVKSQRLQPRLTTKIRTVYLNNGGKCRSVRVTFSENLVDPDKDPKRNDFSVAPNKKSRNRRRLQAKQRITYSNQRRQQKSFSVFVSVSVCTTRFRSPSAGKERARNYRRESGGLCETVRNLTVRERVCALWRKGVSFSNQTVEERGSRSSMGEVAIVGPQGRLLFFTAGHRESPSFLWGSPGRTDVTSPVPVIAIFEKHVLFCFFIYSVIKDFYFNFLAGRD
jgi:hypothetical protein